MGTLLGSITDATNRGWRLVFRDGEHGEFIITARKDHDGKRWMSQRVLSPGCVSDDVNVAREIGWITDDRRLPPTEAQQFAVALIERKRRNG